MISELRLSCPIRLSVSVTVAATGKSRKPPLHLQNVSTRQSGVSRTQAIRKLVRC